MYTQLSSLSGLENLENVGSLSIHHNNSLNSLQGLNGMDSGPYFLSSLYGQLHTLTTILLVPTIVAVHRGHFSGLSGPSEAAPPLRIVALR